MWRTIASNECRTCFFFASFLLLLFIVVIITQTLTFTMTDVTSWLHSTRVLTVIALISSLDWYCLHLTCRNDDQNNEQVNLSRVLFDFLNDRLSSTLTTKTFSDYSCRVCSTFNDVVTIIVLFKNVHRHRSIIVSNECDLTRDELLSMIINAHCNFTRVNLIVNAQRERERERDTTFTVFRIDAQPILVSSDIIGFTCS
jgi:hypothetical protein